MTLDQLETYLDGLWSGNDDVIATVRKLIAVARVAKAATEDWYFDGSCKDLRRALSALEGPPLTDKERG